MHSIKDTRNTGVSEFSTIYFKGDVTMNFKFWEKKNRKYRITTLAMTVTDDNGHSKTFRQIQATRKFTVRTGRVIKKGERGGWVQDSNSLSHEGFCWIDEDTFVEKGSTISGNAYVKKSDIGVNSSIQGDTLIIDSEIRNSIIDGEVELRETKVSNSAMSEYVFVLKSEITNSEFFGEISVEESFFDGILVAFQVGWASFMNVRLISTAPFDNSFIRHNVQWKNVNLTVSNLEISGKAVFDDVEGEDVLLNIKSKLMLEHVKFFKGSMIHTFLSESNSILGDAKNRKVWIDGILFLGEDGHNHLHGNLRIFGNWLLNKTKIIENAMLNGSKDKTVHLTQCVLEDMATLTFKKVSTNTKTVLLENVHLSHDEEYVIY